MDVSRGSENSRWALAKALALRGVAENLVGARMRSNLIL